MRYILLIVVIICGHYEVGWGKFCGFPLKKLPNWFVPTHYELEISPDLVENKFHGQVSISLIATQVVGEKEKGIQKHIILHAAPNLNIGDVRIFQAQARNPKLADVTQPHIKVKDVCQDDQFKLVVISLDEADRRLNAVGLGSLSNLIVRINFDGSTPLNGQGLVRISFNNEYLNQVQHIVYTHYDQHSGPSSLFPCFDEPTFRVDARLRVTKVDMNMQVYSNTPIESSTVVTEQGDVGNQTRLFHFKPNKSISISQLSFAISRFIAIRVNRVMPGEVVVKLVKTKRDLSKFSVIILRQLHRLIADFFKIKLPIEMLNIISVPEIGRAFETNTLGFIVTDHRVTGQNEYPQHEKAIDTAAQIIRHLARQWVSNLVNIEYEHQRWFFEAILDWIVYFNMEKTSIDFSNTNEYKIYYARKQMSQALRLDSLADAAPLCPLPEGLKNYDDHVNSSKASSSTTNSDTSPSSDLEYTTDELQCIFNPNDETKRTKAVAILNTLEESCWGNFPAVIQKFVDRNKNSVGNLGEFIQMVNSTCHWRPHAALKKLQALRGYPLIKLSFDYQTHTVVINQERFRHDYTVPTTLALNKNNPHQQLWILPITFTYGNEATRWSRRSMFRIYDDFGQQEFKLRDVPENLPRDSRGQIRISWVKANNAFKSFYRVLYSDSMLDHLMKATMFQMSNLDCLQFVDDALALFKSGKVGAY